MHVMTLHTDKPWHLDKRNIPIPRYRGGTPLGIYGLVSCYDEVRQGSSGERLFEESGYEMGVMHLILRAD